MVITLIEWLGFCFYTKNIVYGIEWKRDKRRESNCNTLYTVYRAVKSMTMCIVSIYYQTYAYVCNCVCGFSYAHYEDDLHNAMHNAPRVNML